MLARKLLICIAVCGGGLHAAADPPGVAEEGINVAEIIAKATSETPSPPAKKRPPLPKFEDVTKDMVSREGLFTLWYYPPEATDKDGEKLLGQVPAGFLGERFMLSISIAGGGFFTGFPLEERVVKWELLERRLILVEPQTRFVANDACTISDVVRRTYPERIRTAIRIVTKSPGGDPVIDLGTLLKSNLADLAWTSPGSGAIDAGLSKWTKKKTFELNVEIGVELAVSRMHPPGSFDKKMVHFSFWKLPETGYKPRVADDRVGYFVTAHEDWAKPSSSRDLFNRYIDRWHLVKRDSSLPICEPEQPIIFYIEKTVPVRFRRAVRDGILEWNKAFEKIGFVNALEVRQQTDDNEWKDLDPEDMRYSFFRWIVTGAGFALGPHRANPFTGQIYDADILFDDSVIRFFEREAQTMLPSEAVGMKLRDPPLARFLAEHPQWKRPLREWENAVFAGEARPAERAEMLRRMQAGGHVGCDLVEGMKHQLSMAHTVLAGQPPEVIDRFLYDVVKEMVAHEVGHTLGLRHNFKASSVYSLDEVKRRRKTGEPTTASVMDYNPVLLFAEEPLEGHFTTPTIGPYDYWAIEYGYRPADGTYQKDTPEESSERTESGKTAKEQSEAPAPDSSTIVIDGKEIPKEFVDRLPPEIREIIAQKADQSTSAEQPVDEKPSPPPFPGPDSGELKMLHEIAARGAEPELTYATDADATLFGPDPCCARFDMGSDPMEWAQGRIDLVNKRMDNILDWAVQERESWYHLRHAFVNLLLEKVFVLDYVGRYAGGQYTSRSHRGDPQARPPFELVEPDRQRHALAFIEKHLFQDEFFACPPEVLNHLAASRWQHAGTRVSYTVEFPVLDYVGMIQWWNLFNRLFPNTLRRIHDAELKSAASDKLTVAEYLERVKSACWADVAPGRAGAEPWTDAKPFLSSIRRSLQREYLNITEPLVRTPPGVFFSPDLHAMVQHSLRKLADRVDQTLAAGKLDFASEAHLVSCKSRIDRMLAPELDEYGRGGF